MSDEQTFRPKRRGIYLTKAEQKIAHKHYEAYAELHNDCARALSFAVHETREHILTTLEAYIGGDATRVFVDAEAKRDFQKLLDSLRSPR
jgi:hypothetical protein